jgi:hypothetical protein
VWDWLVEHSASLDKMDWLFGAIAGVVLTLLAQVVVDTIKERRRLAKLRAAIYESLAEIATNATHAVTAIRTLRNANKWDAADDVLAQYLKAGAIPKYEEQIRICKADGDVLRPELDVLEVISRQLLTVAQSSGTTDSKLTDLDEIVNKFKNELRMNHLQAKPFAKGMAVKANETVGDCFNEMRIAFEDVSEASKAVLEQAKIVIESQNEAERRAQQLRNTMESYFPRRSGRNPPPTSQPKNPEA